MWDRVWRRVQAVRLPLRRLQEAAAGARVRIRPLPLRGHGPVLGPGVVPGEGGEGGRGEGAVQRPQPWPSQGWLSSRHKLQRVRASCAMDSCVQGYILIFGVGVAF